MMILSARSCVVFICACSILQPVSKCFADDQKSTDYKWKPTERKKRAAPLASKSLAALKTILSEANAFESSSKIYREYVKSGTFETAKKDFFSMMPTNVRARNIGHPWNRNAFDGAVLVGKIGDRRLLLNERTKEGYPTLDIIELKFEPGKYIDRIIYKDVKDR